MIWPEELRSSEPLLWSPGRGTDVWDLFLACAGDDLTTIQDLVARDPSLVRSHYAYRKPLYFAVREDGREAARFLLERDPDPIGLWVDDDPLTMARDRGYAAMERLLAGILQTRFNASPEGEPVAAAIRARDGGAMRRLLDVDPSRLHAGDGRSSQPVHWATMSRQLDLLDELLERGADIDARRMDGTRPIHLYNGDYHYRGWRDVPKEWPVSPGQVLDHLKARGATVDINTAAHTGDLEGVRRLLDEDPSRANRADEVGGYYLGGGSPLRNAAAAGEIEIVKLLLECGADPNLPEEHIAPRGHALYAAVYNGHHEIARLLLEHGAYPNPPVESSADALSIARMRKDVRMVELLVDHGARSTPDLLAYYGELETAREAFRADPTLADNPEALRNAAGEGHEAFVRLLIEHQPDLPRRAACLGRTRAISELLFAHGMDPNTRDWLMATPLHHSARSGDVERVAMLLDHGADIHARDEDLCSTPLGWAAKFGRTAAVHLLLERGARPNLPDDPAWATPLAWATRRAHHDVADLLRRHGARA